MLLTDDHRVIERCRYISAQAHEPGTFWNTEVGYKYAMSNMQAALGLAQLERVEELARPRSKKSSRGTVGGWVALKACN